MISASLMLPKVKKSSTKINASASGTVSDKRALASCKFLKVPPYST